MEFSPNQILTTPTKAYNLRSRLVPLSSPEHLNGNDGDGDNIWAEQPPSEMAEMALTEELRQVQVNGCRMSHHRSYNFLHIFKQYCGVFLGTSQSCSDTVEWRGAEEQQADAANSKTRGANGYNIQRVSSQGWGRVSLITTKDMR